MTHYLETHNISLGSLPETDILNDSDFVMDVLSANIVTIPEFMHLSKNLQWTFCWIGWASVVFVSYFRFIVYKYLFEQYKMKTLTPINLLTLVVCIAQHLYVVVLQIHETVVAWNDRTLEDITGSWICTPLRLFYLSHVLYTIIGSLGIAIYRIILIKQNTIAKNTFGLKTLSRIIFFGGILILALMMYFASGGNLHPLRPKCMLVPKQNVIEILDAYWESIGHPSEYSYLIVFRTLNISLLLGMVCAELAIYVIFFHHMYKHDNSEKLRRLLDASIIKHRNRQNALTFFSQFCSFVFEISFVIILLFAIWMGTSNNLFNCLMTVLKKISFIGTSVIEVFTSSNLRKKVFEPFKR